MEENELQNEKKKSTNDELNKSSKSPKGSQQPKISVSTTSTLKNRKKSQNISKEQSLNSKQKSLTLEEQKERERERKEKLINHLVKEKSSFNGTIIIGGIIIGFFLLIGCWFLIQFIISEKPKPPILSQLQVQGISKFTKEYEKKKLYSELNSLPLFIPVNETEVAYQQNKNFEVLGFIPKLNWSPDHPFLDLIIKRNFPIVLKNTFVNKWKAMKNWNPEYISSNIKKPLVNIYQHTKPIFGPYWDSSKPMGSIRTIKRRNAHQESTMTMKELVSRMKSESSEDYVYYSANINAIEEILLDIYPWELLELDPNSEKQNMNFWIGKKGTIADTHYDGYYNFYVQVYGKKKWNVFSPDQNLYPYPFLHPSHAQSQIVITEENINETLFPKFKGVKGYEVILETGDVFYLPPLWYHRVESLEDSIAVNCWSMSDQSHFMPSIIEHRNNPYSLAQSLSWSKAQLTHSIVLFLEAMFNSLNREQENFVYHFIKHLVEVRYFPLMKTGELPEKGDSSLICREGFNSKEISDVKKKYLNSLVRHSVEQAKLLPLESRDLWLGNLVEYFAYFVTGGKSEHVGPFLLQCFVLNDETNFKS